MRTGTRATVVVVALIVLLGVAVLPTATATVRPTAPSAEMSLAQLRAEVARTADRLAAGTVEYERSYDQLGQQGQLKVATERALHTLLVETATTRQHVATFANALYRNPVDPLVSAALAGDQRVMTDTIYLRRHSIQNATAVQASAELLTRHAAQMQDVLAAQTIATDAVARLQADLQERHAALRADAAASQLRLERGLAALRAREAQLAARQWGSDSGAPCSRGLPPGSVNGFFPSSALCALTASPGHRLIAPAASAFNAMSVAFAADQGRPLCITDSYRDYASQVDVFRRKPSLAAIPGRSQHGLGAAVDLCGGIQNFGTPEYLWMKNHAAEFGFDHPEWAEPDGSRPEPWHWEFRL